MNNLDNGMTSFHMSIAVLTENNILHPCPCRDRTYKHRQQILLILSHDVTELLPYSNDEKYRRKLQPKE